MNIVKKAASINTKAYRRLVATMMNRAALEPNLRNGIITSDFFIEPDTAPQDEFELFKYIYERTDSPFVPYYIMHVDCPAYPEIKEKYGSSILDYDPRDIRSFARRLYNIMRTVKFVCGGFQALHSLMLGTTLAIKNSPYIYSIFTQHGVNFFKDNFINQSSYSQFLFDKIMVSNDFETNLFIERGCYKPENIIKNGLFRWDLLNEDSIKYEKTIFIYFTHRRYLKNIMDLEEAGEHPGIAETVYVKTIKDLLSSDYLRDLTENKGYKLKVALHHTVVQKCGTDILEGVEILEDSEIADAKKEASILITDYSSMCFEMWFQKKPVIYLNIHDSEDCERFRHKTDLPAPYEGKADYIANIADNVEDCLALLKKYEERGFEFTAEEAEKRERFFYFNSGFCERFYGELLKMSNQTKDLYELKFDQPLNFATDADVRTAGVDYPNETGRFVIRRKALVGGYLPETDKSVAALLVFAPHVSRSMTVSVSVNGYAFYKKELTDCRPYYAACEIRNEWIDFDGYVEFEITVDGFYPEDPMKRMKAMRSLKLMQLVFFECERGKALKKLKPYARKLERSYLYEVIEKSEALAAELDQQEALESEKRRDSEVD